jgi:hypothetical protein
MPAASTGGSGVTPDRFSQHNPLDASLKERLDKVFSHKAVSSK